jgi:hypothetical protein
MSLPDGAVGDQTGARRLAKVQFGGTVPLCDDFGNGYGSRRPHPAQKHLKLRNEGRIFPNFYFAAGFALHRYFACFFHDFAAGYGSIVQRLDKWRLDNQAGRTSILLSEE